MLWNFFQDEPILTTTEFPNDYDTTSLALAILDGYRPPDVIHQTLDASLYNQFPDHLLLVYDDPSRPRFDPIVCVHIYILFLVNHRSHELTPTWNYTCDFLEFSAYEQGTYYYASPEYFLYALARMILYSRHREIPLPTLRKHLVPNRTSNTNHFSALFRARCRERINAGPSNAIGLALQIIACRTAGITPTDLEADAERLRTLQEIDGGWPWCEIYRAPSANAGIGSRGVVTSFAVRALQMMDENRVYGDLLGETQTLALGWRSFWRTSAGSWLLHLPMSLKDALPKTISIVCIVAQAWLGSKMHLVLSWGRGASS